jgi:hypothetical protein
VTSAFSTLWEASERQGGGAPRGVMPSPAQGERGSWPSRVPLSQQNIKIFFGYG